MENTGIILYATVRSLLQRLHSVWE